MNIFWELFKTFFLIGLFSFGGGLGMLPMIEQEVVFNHKWMTAKQLYDFVGIAESTPGPLAINLSTFIGFEQAGFWGAALATFGAVVPSFVIILIIAKFFKHFSSNVYVKGILNGIRPIVLGLIFTTCIKVIFTNLFSGFGFNASLSFSWQALVISLLLFIIYFLFWKIKKKKIQPIPIVIMGAILGIVFHLF